MRKKKKSLFKDHQKNKSAFYTFLFIINFCHLLEKGQFWSICIPTAAAIQAFWNGTVRTNEFNKYISKQYYLHAWVDINILIYFLNIKFSCRYRVITDVCKSYHHRNDLPKSPKCYVQLAFPTQKDVHKTINWVKRMWILHESMQSYFFG